MATGNTNANIIKGIQSKTVSLNMENGDQVIRPDSNKLLARVTIEKPATMVAGNIKNGVSIGGVTGSYTGLVPTGKKNITDMFETDVTNYATAQVVDANIVAGNIKSGVSILGVAGSMQAQKEEQTKTVTFSGDGQEVTPDTSKVLSKVTINKPSTLLAENVKKDVVIAGVTGTYEGGGMAAPSNSMEKTYKVLAGESVTAGDFVQTLALTGNNNLNPSGTTLIDLQQVSTGKYAVLYYQSGLNLKICEIDNNNNIINEGTPVTLTDVYQDPDAYTANIIVLSTIKIGIVYYSNSNYGYIKLNVYDLSGNTLTLNFTHNIYSYSSSDYNKGLLCAKLIAENKILSLRTSYSSSGNYARVYARITDVGESSATTGYDHNIIYNDSTINNSTRYKGKPNIFVNDNNEVIIAMVNDSYFYYAICTVTDRTITFLNKVSKNVAYGTGFLQVSAGSGNQGVMNQPIMINNYLILYKTYRSSSDSYGAIRSYSYDNENKVFTEAKLYQDDEYYSYGRMIPVNSNQFMAIRFRENTSYALNYQNTTYALYTIDNDGTITRTHKLSLLSDTTTYTFASLYTLSTDSVYTSLAGVNICYKTNNNAIAASPLIAQVYIKKANNNVFELMIAAETKTQGQDCVVYQYRTYYEATLNLINITSNINEVNVPVVGSISITLTAGSGYSLPASITVTGCTYSYDSITGVVTLSNATSDVTITANGE